MKIVTQLALNVKPGLAGAMAISAAGGRDLDQTVWDRISPRVWESVVELAEVETLMPTLSTRINPGVVTRWGARTRPDDVIPGCPTGGQSMRRGASDRPRAILGLFCTVWGGWAVKASHRVVAWWSKAAVLEWGLNCRRASLPPAW